MITSLAPGRARIRSARLQSADNLQSLLAALKEVPHVTQLTPNPVTGSVLIHFDAEAMPVAEMRTRLEEVLPEQTPVAAKPVAPPPVPAKAATAAPSANGSAFNVGQGVKLGMVSSLGLSLFWAQAGRKGLHKQTGGLFVASLAAHLWMHRKRMFK